MVIVFRLRELREQHKVGLRALAKAAGLNKSTIVRLEAEGMKGLELATLDKLLAGFAKLRVPITVADILQHTPDAPPQEPPP